MADLTKKIIDLDTEAVRIAGNAEKEAAKVVYDARKEAEEILSKAHKEAAQTKEAEFEKLRKSLELFSRKKRHELKSRIEELEKRLDVKKTADEIADEIARGFLAEMRGG